jgi:hypothetical protein
MTVTNAKRATSKPSTAPNMPHTPDFNTSAARERFESKRRMEDRQKLKDDIIRLLRNDNMAMCNARKHARSANNWHLSDREQQERMLKDAALEAIQHRKECGYHVSNKYPLFVDFLPNIMEGKAGRDVEKEDLISKQLDLLESEEDDEESDDEDLNPSLKKEEGEDAPEIKNSVRYSRKRVPKSTKGDLSAQRYLDSVRRCKSVLPTPRQSTARASTSRQSSSTESDDDGYTSPGEAESEADSESDEDDGEEEDKQRVPLVAVTRGLPVIKDLPETTKSVFKPKHRFATKTDFRFKAVLRGQIVGEQESGVEWVWEENKGLTLKKRVRETKNEGRGQKHKKAKVEADT